MAVDAVAVNVALPGIQADLDATTGELQWTVGAFMASIAASVVAVSRLGDILGRRRVFAWGLVLFALGSLSCGLAPDVPWLLASRVVQGVGGAAVYSLSLAVITASRPQKELGRGVAAWAVASGLALAIGPLVGGILISAFDWRAVFLVNVPLALLALALTIALLPESRDEEAGRGIDVRGIALLTLGLAMLMTGLIQAGSWGWGSPVIIALIAGSLLPLAGFFWFEGRAREPLIDLGLFFGNLRFVGANLLAIPAYGTIYAVLFVAPLYLQTIQGYSAAEAGLRLLPFPLVFFLLSRWVGRFVGRVGTLAPMLIGSALMVASTTLLSFAGADTGEAMLAVAFGLLGAGQAFALIGISAAALGSVPPGKAGAASGIRSTFSYVGGALWVAVAGAILVAVERSSLGDATQELGRRLTAEELRDADGLLAGSAQAEQAVAALSPLDQDQVRAAAADAFVAGMSWAMRLCAISVALVALVTLALYRRAEGRERIAEPPAEHSALHPPAPAAHPRPAS